MPVFVIAEDVIVNLEIQQLWAGATSVGQPEAAQERDVMYGVLGGRTWRMTQRKTEKHSNGDPRNLQPLLAVLPSFSPGFNCVPIQKIPSVPCSEKSKFACCQIILRTAVLDGC